MTPTIFLINPTAGKVNLPILERTIAKYAQESNTPYKTYIIDEWSSVEKDLRLFLEDGYLRVAIAGGDGTIARIASFLHINRDQFKTECGIIPVGTANMMAKILNIPIALDKAIQLVFENHMTKSIDALCIDQRLFFQQISVGFSSISTHALKKEDKVLLGNTAYVVAAIKQISRLSHNTYTLVSRQQTKTIQASDIIIANTGAILNPRYELLLGAAIDDGYFNVYAVKAKTVQPLLKIIFSSLFLKRRHIELEEIEKTKQITITSQRALPVQADGDIIGETPVTISVIPQAVDFIVASR